MKMLLIYGSGGLGREMVDLAQRINQKNNQWNEICFIDDDDSKNGTVNYNRRVMDFTQAAELQKHINTECIIAVGEPAVRQMLFEKCKQVNFKMASLIAPTAIISDTAVIGEGVIVSHNAVVSSDCRIGNNVLLQPICSIGHDSVIESSSVISSFVSIAGQCTVGSISYIGMGATVREKVRIGNETIISMGAAVMKDMPDEMIVMGNPARPIKRNENKRVFV